MEDTFTLSRTELKGFFKCISKKFNIPYKTIALEYNSYIESISDSVEGTNACTEHVIQPDVPAEQPEQSLTCTAVKKDKTLCGKKATVGDRCNVHKPKKSAADTEPVIQPDVPQPEQSLTCTAVKKDKTVCGKKATVGDRCSVHKPKKSAAATEDKQDVAQPEQSLTCTAVKKDKTVCGKKATVGDRCSVHKPKKSAVATEPVIQPDVPAEQLKQSLTCTAVKKDKTVCGKKATVGDKCNVHKPKNSEGKKKYRDDEDIILTPLPEPTKIVYKIEMHPRLGLYWDRTGGTRFVFSKKTGEYVAIAKYTHMTHKLSDKDVELCQKFSLPYVVTDLANLKPEYPDQITIDGEYDRIKFELENEEFERKRHASQHIIDKPIVEACNSILKPVQVEQDANIQPATISEPVVVENTESIPVEKSPKKPCRVKNLSVDPKRFPKHRKDIQTMDIVDSLKEIIAEPELEDTIV